MSYAEKKKTNTEVNFITSDIICDLSDTFFKRLLRFGGIVKSKII